MVIRRPVGRWLARLSDVVLYGSHWPRCRECWLPRSSGRHSSIATCEALVAGRRCPEPSEHHRYRMFR